MASSSSQPPPQQQPYLPAVALDCEMVGCGPKGSVSVLARVAVVDERGNVLLDSYVSPPEVVTDYRTRWSGIKPQHLKNAPSRQYITAKVRELTVTEKKKRYIFFFQDLKINLKKSRNIGWLWFTMGGAISMPLGSTRQRT
jgi:hypothetical protein